MVGRRRAWFAIASVAVTLSFFVYLLPKYWSQSENTNLGVAAVSAGTHVGSPESQPYPQTTRQPSSGQSPRLASSDSEAVKDGTRANIPIPYHRGETAPKRDLHVLMPRQMPIDQMNFTAYWNGAVHPPIPLNQERGKDKQPNVKAKRKFLLCSPNKITNATALGFQPLSQSVVEGVEKFVFFVGYDRSGHSLIGSVMDAHPDIVMAHEHFLFAKCASQLKAGVGIFDNKTKLFNELYRNSYLSSQCGWRSASNTSKGYNLDVEGQWQGTFRQLRVIGDKSGGKTTEILRSGKGKECLEQMVNSLNMPIIAVHVVRNPYDMVATNILYRLSAVKGTKASDLLHRKLRPDITMQSSTASKFFSKALAVTTLSKNFTVVEIHIEDYIEDPKKCVFEICNALGVLCPQDYVDECYQKAYRNVSRSRDLIEWDPVIKRRIQAKIKEFPFFHGYTFEDDFRS